MNLTLKRFYQAVDLAYPDKVTYYLVLVGEDGREILLPVQKETTEALVEMLYANGIQKEAQPEAEDIGESPEEDFDQEVEPGVGEGEEEVPEDDGGGDGEDGDLEDLEPGNGVLAVSPEIMRRAIAAQKARQQVPESEDEVPSL